MFAVLRTVAAVLAVAVLGGQASPVSRRDVIAPKITSPTAASVWPIGTTQTVTWDTSDFPPVSQITNIIGQVILGFEANNSLNLDFNNPLASGFNLTDGSVQITVPNVTPRDDYLIVLFGDSGNTSPAFSITRISAPANPSSTATSSSATPPSSSTVSVSNPPSPPIVGSTITGGESSTTVLATPTGTESTTLASASLPAPSTTPTAPSTTSGTASTGTGTALGAQTTTSAARALRPAGGNVFQMAALCAGAALSALVLL